MSDTNWNDVLNKIRTELSDLAKYVDSAKKGIENLESTVKVSSEKFPEASRNLSAVSEGLEDAANSIIGILEGLVDEKERAQKLLAELSAFSARLPEAARARHEELVSELGGINTRSKANLMDMFASLAFHDLSGQKLKKVMVALAAVEKKVAELALTFGFAEGHGPDAGKRPAAGGKDAGAAGQDDVDRILKQMGGKSSS